MITQEQFDAWPAALRSGDYKQGFGRLCVLDEDGNEVYCCLGVLAEIIGMVKDDSVPTRMYSMPGSSSVFTGSSAMLDQSVLPIKVQVTLSRLNDSGGSFAFMADEIERRRDEIVGPADVLGLAALVQSFNVTQ